MMVKLEKFPGDDYKPVYDSSDFEDADAAFLLDVKSESESLQYVFADDRLAGIVQLCATKNAFLYIFIFPAFRRQGVGSRALELSEEYLRRHGAETILTTYRANRAETKRFAVKHGYKQKFSSAYMKYTGGKFPLLDLPIRGYRNADFDAAFKLYAEAFHRMRVSVGDFPDSVIAQPNEKARQAWNETANERFVFVEEGIVVGYAHIEGNEIGSVAVRIQDQGHGIGRRFVKFICNTILDRGNDFVSLYCVVGNNARRLYDSLGFREVYIADYATKPAP